MRWAQLDLERGTWVLGSEETKSARSHLVPLSRQAVTLLQLTPRFGAYVWTTDGKTHIQGCAGLAHRRRRRSKARRDSPYRE